MKNLVEQFVDTKRIARQLDSLDCPQFTLAGLVGVSEAAFSLWLSHQKAFSVEAQRCVLEVVEFLQELHQQSDLPINFSDLDRLKPHLEKWRRMRTQEEVVRTEAELREQDA